MAPVKKRRPMTEALIDDVQLHSSLRDKRSKDYKDIMVKANSWMEILSNLRSNFSDEDLESANLSSLEAIKKHWANLRDTYSRVKKKLKGKSGAGNNLIYF
jgi:hypothetical protein